MRQKSFIFLTSGHIKISLVEWDIDKEGGGRERERSTHGEFKVTIESCFQCA